MRKALCFLTLIFSTIVLSLVAFAVFPFDRKGVFLHQIERLWARLFLHAGGIKVSISGKEHFISSPSIFISNHQSALDIFVLLASLPVSFRFVAKRELFQIPFMGWAMKCVGHISIDRHSLKESKKALEEAAQKIQKGLNVLIFPEGTRSTDGKLLPFKKGAFHLVNLAKVPVIPLAIYGSHILMPKGKILPVKAGTVWIEVGEPIYQREDQIRKNELADKVRQEVENLLKEGQKRAFHDN
ncbi:MAG: 1-acyl-sn-glycerol-3-phosphate acyltransferase [Deltaproteobacteria bacterium]|nr:1-acyl-sn-glycerol-3-phosphate acyltransferase [Deltaproteobacteria bacterium]